MDRLDPVISTLDATIETLDVSLRVLGGAQRTLGGQAPLIPAPPPDVVLLRRRVKIMPTLVEVLRSAPPGIYHGNILTDWVGQRMRLPAKNPKNGIATAMSRLSKKGLVKAHGDNNWEWIGDREAAAS